MIPHVAPFTGAWIEILALDDPNLSDNVAPFTGAWIEINETTQLENMKAGSLPSRERGLKCLIRLDFLGSARRSLHGSVD